LKISKSWKLISLAMVIIMLAAMLVACGDNTATPVPATTAATTKAATTAAATTAAGATTAATTTTAAGATTAAATTAAATTAAGATTAAAAPAPTITPIPPVAQPAGSLKITLWFGLTGALGNVVQQTVNKYNTSQSKYYVEAIQQPDYDATLNKFNTSQAGGSLPSVVQIYDIGTQRMIDSKRVLPVQDFIDRDKLDVVSDIEPAVRNYYTVGGKLYSMPFNTSSPVMYFNKAAFKEAGLDTEKRIWTYDEVFDAAKKLTKKDSSGKVTQYGAGFTAYSWLFEQELAIQNALFADPNNGRETRSSKLIFNTDTGANWPNFLKKLLDEAPAKYFGRDGGANSTARDSSFVTGESAITFNSIANLRGYLSSAQTAGKGVDVGVAYLPRPTGATGGVIIGGASLWITDQGSKEQQEAAWDFVKWTSQPETQAYWSANTGYYPIRKAAYNVQDMKDTLAKYPQFQIAVDQLRASPSGFPTAGAIFGTFISTRQNIEAAMDQLLTKGGTTKQLLDDAAKKSNEQLDEYNSTVKK